MLFYIKEIVDRKTYSEDLDEELESWAFDDDLAGMNEDSDDEETFIPEELLLD